MKVTLTQATPNPVETIAQIASICYDSDPKNPLGLVKHLYRNGHHSVFEHIYFTFKIEGISRACSHQIVRHRHCSFTQRSQRYCSEDGFGAVRPKSIEEIDTKEGYANFLYEVEENYRKLQALGVPNEDARYEQYWNGDPILAKCYREAEELRNEKKNQELWLQGMYIYEAICDVSPILRPFAKKGTKPAPYPTSPYPLTEKQRRREQDAKERKLAEKGRRFMEALMRSTNARFKEETQD